MITSSRMNGDKSVSFITMNFDFVGCHNIPKSSVQFLRHLSFLIIMSRPVAKMQVSSICSRQWRSSNHPSGPTADMAATVASMKKVKRGQLLLAPCRTPAEVENCLLPTRPEHIATDLMRAFRKVLPQPLFINI